MEFRCLCVDEVQVHFRDRALRGSAGREGDSDADGRRTGLPSQLHRFIQPPAHALCDRRNGGLNV